MKQDGLGDHVFKPNYIGRNQRRDKPRRLIANASLINAD